MLKIGKMADYALVLMGRLARSPAAQLRMEQLADSTGLGLPTVRKVMRLLVAAGLVRSVRGARGGYQLARLPEMISVAQVIAAVEGPPAITECCETDSDCELHTACDVAPHMPMLNSLIDQLLSTVSLADLSQLNAGVHFSLEAILGRMQQRLAPATVCALPQLS